MWCRGASRSAQSIWSWMKHQVLGGKDWQIVLNIRFFSEHHIIHHNSIICIYIYIHQTIVYLYTPENCIYVYICIHQKIVCMYIFVYTRKLLLVQVWKQPIQVTRCYKLNYRPPFSIENHYRSCWLDLVPRYHEWGHRSPPELFRQWGGEMSDKATVIAELPELSMP